MKTVYAGIILLSLLFGVAQTFAQRQIEPLHYRLKNGLEVLIAEMHDAPIAISVLYYKVGSRNEPLGKSGISHVVEHMMFKGTAKYPQNKIVHLFKQNAGIFNAYTTQDMTVYYEQLPANKIELALQVESDRMVHCQFDPQEFQRELNVVKEERRMRVENNPASAFREEMNAAFYLHHPYRWPVIGWATDLNHLTREDAYQYYRDYYRPNNAVLVLVGDFNTQKMLKLVKKYFGKIPPGKPVPPVTIQEPPMRARRIIQKYAHQVVNPYYTRYYRGVTYTSSDLPPLLVALRILSTGRTSRLYRRLVTTRLCKTVTFSLRRRIDLSPIVFGAELFPTTPMDTVLNILEEEIQQLARGNFTEREIRRAKVGIRIDQVYDNMKISEIAGKLGTYFIKAGNFHYDALLTERILSVTKADIQRVVQTYLQTPYFVEGQLLPSDTLLYQPSPLSEQTGIASPPLHEVFTLENAMPVDTITSSLEDLPMPPPLAPRIQQDTLANGIPVWFFQDTRFPITEIAGVIHIGNAALNETIPGLGMVTVQMMREGSHRFPYETLIDTLSMLGTSVFFNGGYERINFSWGTINENIVPLTHIAVSLLTDPAFPQASFERIKARRLAALRAAQRKTGWEMSYYLMNKIFAGHPYHRMITQEGVERITLTDIQQFYQTYFRPELTHLIVLSSLPFTTVKSLLEETLGRWHNPHPYHAVPYPSQQPLSAMEIVVFHNPEDQQVTVRIAHGAPHRHHPDYLALQIANHILGGNTLTSRLGKRLRVDLGLTYGVTTQLRGRNHGGWWQMQTRTAAENVGSLIINALQVIEEFRHNGASTAEILAAKRYYIGTLPMAVESPLDIYSLLVDMVRHQQPPTYLDQWPQKFIQISPQAIHLAAQQYIHPERSIIAVGGNITAAELQRQLSEALKQVGTSLPYPLPISSIQQIEIYDETSWLGEMP